MKNFDQIRLRIGQRLNESSEQLIRGLNNAFGKGWPDSSEILDFECFEDGYGVAFYPMTRDATQLGYEMVLESVLAGEEFDLCDDDWEEVVDEINEFSKQTRLQFRAWFHDCWKKSDFAGEQLPMYFCFHDDIRSLNLKTGKVINDHEKWG